MWLFNKPKKSIIKTYLGVGIQQKEIHITFLCSKLTVNIFNLKGLKFTHFEKVHYIAGAVQLFRFLRLPISAAFHH